MISLIAIMEANFLIGLLVWLTEHILFLKLSLNSQNENKNISLTNGVLRANFSTWSRQTTSLKSGGFPLCFNRKNSN